MRGEPPVPTKMCGCGYTHPPPWDKDCPLMATKDLGSDDKGVRIATFVRDLSKFLKNRNDYENIIVAFENTISKL